MLDDSLIFFDKEGHSLNYNYNSTIGRYEGDVIFHENSSDTYKTQAIYMFQKLDAFEYDNPPDLTIRKFQLFNEFGINFYNSKYFIQSIISIEPVNQEPDYYSKWVYGDEFHRKFPIGTVFRFNSNIFEFTNTDQTYVVISTKRGAIMIITFVDNQTFNFAYPWGLASSYVNQTVSSMDVIGIYNYVDSTTFVDNLSPDWNEPGFYDVLYTGRKLNIVNTSKNDEYKPGGNYEDVEVVTIENPDILDIVHFEYYLNELSVGVNQDVEIEVITRTDLPMVYQGGVQFVGASDKLIFTSDIPTLLKPGIQFKVINSVLNTQFFTVDNVSNFTGNANLINYVIGDQVMWNNQISECVLSHTWYATSSTNPDSATFWGDPTYLPLAQTPVNETLLQGDIYLTNDHLYFSQSYTFSSAVTLASAADRFKEDLSSLNIDIYYDINNSRLVADLIYPTQYAMVNFYTTALPGTAVGSTNKIYENAIEIEESIVREFNYDISENFDYNVVFTDIDEYGIIVTINKEVYQEEVEFLYSSGVVDMERSMHKTLRNWYSNNAVGLILLGIIPTLQTIGSVSPYYNSINLATQYPNIPLEFNVKVGSTADFYIEHSYLTFYDPSNEGVVPGIGNYINIQVNNRSYGISHLTPDISQTLQNWVDNYYDILDNYGIYVKNAASTLEFRVKSQRQRCDIVVSPGLSTLPGDFNYKLSKKFTGNHGALITSNEILLGTASATQSQYQSLENAGFATGMVVGINGTVYPLQNVEYNSLYLEPEVINLSYEGPFWGSTSSLCNVSPFLTIAFNGGFGATACVSATSSGLGMFNSLQFGGSFTTTYINSITYSVNTYNISSYVASTASMVDIKYIQLSNTIMVLDNNVIVYDAINASYTDSIDLNGNTSSISILFNDVDSYVYALSLNGIYQIDPFTNNLVSSASHSNAYAFDYNTDNGDVYVTTDSSVLIYNNAVLVQTISGSSYNLVFNDFEKDMYVARRNGTDVNRINGSSRSIQSTYTIAGLTNDRLVYDRVNESVYVYGSVNLYKIDNNSVTPIPLVLTGGFNDMIFNNTIDSINISNDNPLFSALDISDDTYKYNEVTTAYGYQLINYYDGQVYISNQDPLSASIDIYNSNTGDFNEQVLLNVGENTTKLTWDPDRNSMWFIQPTLKRLIEVVSSITLSIITVPSGPPISITESNYGTLASDYIERNYLWLHTRDYIRRPRANFNDDVDVNLYWKWFSGNVPEFFLYDFSGNMLPTSSVLSYTGDKPLETVRLNLTANRDMDKVKSPEYQQTVFGRIDHILAKVDDEDDYSIVPEPIETFIGFNSVEEGALRSILQLYQEENVDYTIDVTKDVSNIISIDHIDDPITGDRYGKISLAPLSTDIFLTDSDGLPRGFKPGQHVAMFITDITNSRNQYISNNNGYLLKIRNVYSREITFDYFKSVDVLSPETSIVSDYPSDGSTTYLSVRLKVWDREIGRFNVFGQTEIEDIRYKIELGNTGKLISSDDVYIYKEYDIKEEGIDWTYLNSKRKEMILMRSMIYPYIGSYKSIINAINHFGYNDLELYEYYRNVDILSESYDKLYKVEIPDIFDNSVEGWTENDFIKHTFPNKSYEETNLFNLTYRITDREGNNVLNYTLQEIQTKLQGLKYWLQSNIIPITHKILDITGRADFVGVNTISHSVKEIQIIKISENLNPVSFKLNETYLMPVNNGSTVYNCVLDFYLYGTYSYNPDYYTVDISTYEIYREWYALKTYGIGEKIVYLDKLYESMIPTNKANNPRKYQNISTWKSGTFYNLGDIVKEDRDYYAYSAWGVTVSTATASFVNPSFDSGTTASNWVDITEWREYDMTPIQHITERRRISDLKPYNFTIDSNIDPYLVIEVTSENGYGATYRDKKNYEIRGILDIQELEAFSNLTSKQYIDATLGTTYV